MRKHFKQLIAFVLAVILVFASSASSKAASKKSFYWDSTKETTYDVGENNTWNVSYEITKKYKNGNLVDYKSVFYRYNFETKKNEKGEVYETKYKYKKGSYMVSTDYVNGTLNGKAKYTYNKKGDVAKYQQYDSKNKLESTTTYKYDKKGNQTSSVTKYTDKSKKTVKEKTKYTYKKGKMVKAVTTSTDGFKSVIDYKKEAVVKEKYTYSDGSSYEYRYNSKGQQTEEFRNDSYCKAHVKYSYNKKGQCIKSVSETEIKESGDKSTTTTTYKYKTDKNGNVTETLEYSNGELARKTVFSGYKKIYY